MFNYNFISYLYYNNIFMEPEAPLKGYLSLEDTKMDIYIMLV